MLRRSVVCGVILSCTAALWVGPSAAGDSVKGPIRVIFHVDDNEPSIFKRAIANASILLHEAEDLGRPAFVKIVINASGLPMAYERENPVADRLAVMEVEFPTFQLVVCEQSAQYVAQQEGREPDFLDMVVRTPSAVLLMADLQSEGWSYIKP